ncbi:MAG: carbohydrate-binding domain-containing protein, partial [Pseudomonadota bacterium]
MATDPNSPVDPFDIEAVFDAPGPVGQEASEKRAPRREDDTAELGPAADRVTVNTTPSMHTGTEATGETLVFRAAEEAGVAVQDTALSPDVIGDAIGGAIGDAGSPVAAAADPRASLPGGGDAAPVAETSPDRSADPTPPRATPAPLTASDAPVSDNGAGGAISPTLDPAHGAPDPIATSAVENAIPTVDADASAPIGGEAAPSLETDPAATGSAAAADGGEAPNPAPSPAPNPAPSPAPQAAPDTAPSAREGSASDPVSADDAEAVPEHPAEASQDTLAAPQNPNPDPLADMATGPAPQTADPAGSQAEVPAAKGEMAVDVAQDTSPNVGAPQSSLAAPPVAGPRLGAMDGPSAASEVGPLATDTPAADASIAQSPAVADAPAAPTPEAGGASTPGVAATDPAPQPSLAPDPAPEDDATVAPAEPGQDATPPVAETPQEPESASVAEGAAGAQILDLGAAGTVSDDRFEVVEGVLQLRDGVTLDHEAEPALTLEITDAETGALRRVEVAVTDINEAPDAVTLTVEPIAENAAGATVGRLDVTDADAGDSHSFTVSDDRFEVVDGTLKLKDGTALDHEAGPVSVAVTATDAGGLSHTQSFAVSADDINEAPIAIALVQDGANLIQNGSFETFEVQDGGWKQFSDDASGGWEISGRAEVWDGLNGIAASEGAQHAELDAQHGQDSLAQTVSTTPGQVYDLGLDLRERLAGGTDTVEILWNGAPVATLDPSSDAWERFELQVVGTGDDRLEIREVAGENDSYGALLDNITLTQAVDTVAENTAGAVVGTLDIVDPDAADTHTLTVSDDRFEVVDGTLKLKDGIALDHEVEADIALSVTATDAAGNSHTQAFDLQVADLNEAPHALTLDAARPEIPPDVPAPGDSVPLTVRLAGEAYKGDPKYEIRVDGEVVASGSVDWSRDTVADGKYDLSGDGSAAVDWRDITLDVTMPEGGFETVEVRFPNDNYKKGVGDRNLIVDEISLGGQVIEAEGSAVTYHGGKFADGQTSERMPWGGTLSFDVEDVFDAVPPPEAPEGPYVLEGSAGAVVGTLSVADNDAGDSHSFAVSDDRFEVADGTLKLKDGIALDATGDAPMSVAVTVTDAAGQALHQTFELAVVATPAAHHDAPPPEVTVEPSFVARYFDQNTRISRLSDIDFSETPTAEEAVGEIDYANGHGSFWDGGSRDTFAAQITGQIQVPEDGVFTFTLGADDGAVLLIDGVPVIDNDGRHAFRTESGEITLDAGP